MSGFDRLGLAAAVVSHGVVVRVVIAGFAGSTPRETGTAMLVWDGGQFGTIGGGALEWEAARAAMRLAQMPGPWVRQVMRVPLGPALGQCCGGHVTLLLERFEAVEMAELATVEGAFVRPLASGAAPGAAEFDNARARRALRAGEAGAVLLSDAMVEPMVAPALPVWLYGAGHVGRAVVRVAEGLPLAITWVDTEPERFPAEVPGHATLLSAKDPARVVARAPDDAVHLVMTYSHALDLGVCHAVLSREFRHLGLIGSASKRARFLTRLRALGHSEAALARLVCPIGERSLGKLPAAIALGVVRDLMRLVQSVDTALVRPA